MAGMLVQCVAYAIYLTPVLFMVGGFAFSPRAML